MLHKTTTDYATLLIHQEVETYIKGEKTYRLQYGPGPRLARTNCVNETREGVLIRDIRSCLDDFSFDPDGFQVLESQIQLSADEFYDRERVRGCFLAG